MAEAEQLDQWVQTSWCVGERDEAPRQREEGEHSGYSAVIEQIIEGLGVWFELQSTCFVCTGP